MRFLLIAALVCASVRCDDALEPRDTVCLERIDASEHDPELPNGGVCITVKLNGPQSECVADDYERAALALLISARNCRQRKVEAEK